MKARKAAKVRTSKKVPIRAKGTGTARAQLRARDPKGGVTVLGSALPFLTRRQYRAAKRVWP